MTDIIKEALIKKGIENKDIVCKICGYEKRASLKHLAVVTAIDPITKQIPSDGRDMAFAAIICQHCGYSEFFSAKHLGIV